MTKQDYIHRINKGDEPYDEKKFSYLHYMEIEILEKLANLEEGLMEVLEHVEKEGKLDLSTEKEDMLKILDSYYKALKNMEAEYITKLDDILWNKIYNRLET